ncbi:hypothetical protein V5G28_025365 [Scytonema sp. PRP1]
MGEILTFCRQQHRSAIPNTGNSSFVRVFVSPILLTLLCLTATCRDAKAQSSSLKTGTIGTQRHRNTENSPHPHVSGSPRPLGQHSPPAPALLSIISYGNQISLNGRTLSGAWLQQRQKTGSLSIHLSDGAVKQLFGVDLLDTSNPTTQPIQWFSSNTKPLVLTSLLTTGYRYLDITNIAKIAQWQMQANGKTLVITTPSAKVTNIYQDKQPVGDRIILDLDRPTPWQITQGVPARKPQPQIEDKGIRGQVDKENSFTQLPLSPPVSSSLPNREWTITLDAIADPALVQRYTPPSPSSPSSPSSPPFPTISLIPPLCLINT